MGFTVVSHGVDGAHQVERYLFSPVAHYEVWLVRVEHLPRCISLEFLGCLQGVEVGFNKGFCEGCHDSWPDGVVVTCCGLEVALSCDVTVFTGVSELWIKEVNHAPQSIVLIDSEIGEDFAQVVHLIKVKVI